MRRALIGAAILFSTVARTSAAQDDGCNEILRQGVYDYIAESSLKSFRSRDTRDICSRLEKTDIDNVAWTSEAQYYAISGSGDYTSEKFSSLRDAYCSITDSSQESVSKQEKFLKVVNQGVVDAWSACKAAGKKDIAVSTSIDDERIDFAIKTPNTGAKSFEVQFTTGVSCAGEVLDGKNATSLPGSWKRISVGNLAPNDQFTFACFRDLRPDLEATRCGETLADAAQVRVKFKDANANVYDIPVRMPRVRAARSCTVPECEMRATWFGKGSAGWSGAPNHQCRDIPTDILEGHAKGSGAGSNAATWVCKGFEPGSKVVAHGTFSMRALRGDGKHVNGNCWCNGSSWTMGADLVRRNGQTWDVLYSTPTRTGTNDDACSGGLTDTVIGTFEVPSDGTFEIAARVRVCENGGPTNCQFVQGSALKIEPKPAKAMVGKK